MATGFAPFGRDLKDRWCRPTREAVREVIPSPKGQPAVVVLDSMIGLDGATGRPRWDGRGSTTVLDAGESGRPPRVLSESGEATVCRLALATTPEGAFQPARGAPIAHGATSDDPRWMRPLPWYRTNGAAEFSRAFFAFCGLALINIVIPLMVLKLATRRRVWGVSQLLALPVVVAVPMAGWIAIYGSLPVVELIAGSLVGLAILEYTVGVSLSIRNGRWRRLALRVCLTALVTVAIGSWLLWSDMRGMTAIERYTWSGWYLIVIPGAFVIGALACVIRIVQSVFRIIRRPRRPAATNPPSSE